MKGRTTSYQLQRHICRWTLSVPSFVKEKYVRQKYARLSQITFAFLSDVRRLYDMGIILVCGHGSPNEMCDRPERPE